MTWTIACLLIGFGAGGLTVLAATARDARRHEEQQRASGPRPARADEDALNHASEATR